MKSTNKTIAFLLVITCVLITPSAKQRTQQVVASQATSVAQPVTLHVTVTDKAGWFVAGLQAKDFEISVDKKLAQIVSAEHADSPFDIGIVVDLSGSMVGGSESKAAKALGVLRESLRQFVEAGNPSNQYFLIGFNRKPLLLSDWTSEPVTLAERFSGLKVYGQTAMYDACVLAIKKLQEGGNAKRALILVSDGQDNSSQYTFNQLRDSLRETNVLLYAIDLPTKYEASSNGVEGRDILDDLSATSGGRAYLTKEGDSRRDKDLGLSLEAIAKELRSQYTISIVASDSKASKKFYKIKVKVNSPAGPMKDLKARTREGFYAS